MTNTTDPVLLEARIKRLEKALRPFAALGRDLQAVKEKSGWLAAGDAARGSSCWSYYEDAAKAFYGDEAVKSRWPLEVDYTNTFSDE